MTKTEDILSVVILTAVASFAASTFLRTLIHDPQLQVRTREIREQMRQVRELRHLKEEFLEAQGSEEAPPDIERQNSESHFGEALSSEH